MSVLLETSKGDIVIDLLVDYAPKLCENFLKLCKIKYYNYAPVHSIQKSFSFQTGDPLGPLSKLSDGGSSIWGVLSGDPARRTFPALFHPKLKHIERGTVGMATVAHPTDPDVRLAASQFIVSLGDDTDFLDGKSAIFGRVVEGFDVLESINKAIVDDNGYPLVDIRIKHTAILDDPYPDPAGLVEPPSSPPPSRAQLDTARLGEEDQQTMDDDPGADSEDKAAAAEKTRREREARAQALTLEMMGDLPFAEVKPPENVLFVCKLNPVTQDADLELIFSRFGTILSCEVIRDRKTGDSLQYAFIEFEDKAACEAAYFKMQDVLIDDRRIHIDFSQSVSKLSDAWRSDTNAKRQKQARGRGGGGGWGGVRELEKWRKYRNEDDDDAGGPSSYGMVHSDEEIRGRHAQAFAKEAAANKSEDRYNGYGDQIRDYGGDRRGGRRDDRDRDRNYDKDRERGRGLGRDNERHERRDGTPVRCPQSESKAGARARPRMGPG
ncbi:peptidyl-prolyl cis-trans isomerase-like 4 [Sporothrix schenckii ATCC 58251]|uniref:Peptidyl-prolyl cis-trans isomerase n=1 Tax=Sporothrix schenckii (strain ATCC 58251 / de Perez 2211183) TaxID=1391915 RepID=U7PXN5_SPOS1|nr:peptidyl-prolyl cis-trans isomerase-like 4 [Sporothrix schenckii ATCC 58251]